MVNHVFVSVKLDKKRKRQNETNENEMSIKKLIVAYNNVAQEVNFDYSNRDDHTFSNIRSY